MSPHRGCNSHWSARYGYAALAVTKLFFTECMIYCQWSVFFSFYFPKGTEYDGVIEGFGYGRDTIPPKKVILSKLILETWSLGYHIWLTSGLYHNFVWMTFFPQFYHHASWQFFHNYLMHTYIWVSLFRGPLRWWALSHGAWSNKKLRNFPLLGQIYNSKKKMKRKKIASCVYLGDRKTRSATH